MNWIREVEEKDRGEYIIEVTIRACGRKKKKKEMDMKGSDKCIIEVKKRVWALIEKRKNKLV